MILQDSFVVVEDGEAGLGLDVEVVGGAGVVEVVDDGGEEQGEDLEVGQPRLGRGQIWNGTFGFGRCSLVQRLFQGLLYKHHCN